MKNRHRQAKRATGRNDQYINTRVHIRTHIYSRRRERKRGAYQGSLSQVKQYKGERTQL